MSGSALHRILAVFLLSFSLINLAMSLRDSYHWPLGRDDDWTRVERGLIHARGVLGALSDHHIEYRIEEASNSYDESSFYRLQNILVPSILQTGETKNQYVLVEFWTTRQVKALPGLILMEDFGNGLGLYRRPPS